MAGLAVVLGISSYIFAINLLGHVISIVLAFYLVLGVFLLCGVAGFFVRTSGQKLEWQTSKKWRYVMWGTVLFLLCSTWVVAFRWPLPLNGTWLPTAATIAEGNFPPMEVWQPQYPLLYHYAPELFSAAIHKVTGLPAHFAYDLYTAFLVSALFLVGFAFAKLLTQSNKTSFIAALLMLYAGTLSFLHVLQGIFLFSKNFFSPVNDVIMSFKFVTDSVSSEMSVPAISAMIIKQPAVALAFATLITFLYLYTRLIEFEGRTKTLVLVCGMLLAVLALTAETYFVVLVCTLLAQPGLSWALTRDWLKAKKHLISAVLVVGMAVPLAVFQGGMLYGIVTGSPLAISSAEVGRSFEVNIAPWTTFTSDVPLFVFWDFVSEWLVLVVLAVPALWFLFRNRLTASQLLIPFIVALFFIPFLVIYTPRPGEIIRFFYPINLLGGLTIGIYLGTLYFSGTIKPFVKKGIALIFFVLMTQAVLFQLLHLSIGYPAFNWNPGKDVYATPLSLEGRAYAWVKTNTSSSDRFLIIKKDYHTADALPNVEFILNTGRMAPTYVYQWPDYQRKLLGGEVAFGYPPELEDYEKIKETCDAETVKALGFSYLFVTAEWLVETEQRCVSNAHLHLNKVFDEREGERFVRIYRIDT